jgi:hypothetical protein
MFSFKRGKPVAVIKGGEYNGFILFVSDLIKSKPKKPCCKKCGTQCYYKPCCKKCEFCKLEIIPKDIQIDDGVFQQIISLQDRIIYIAGPSGSGKSTYAGKYISIYKKIYPKADFYVFSRLDKDPAIDYLKPHRVKIDQSLIDEPIEIKKEIKKNSIILFDDIDTIQDKKLQMQVNRLKGDLLEIGRHMNIRIVVTSHLVNPNERTAARTLLNEMNTLTIFPKSGSNYQSEYALKKYFGLSTKQIKTILNMDSRWITLFKMYPQLVLSEHRAVLLSELL